jgi:recombinational DNA repair ATPase RecF
MRLTSVTADNVLSMEHATVEPGDGLTVIVGPNGAGKTNMVRVVICQGEKSCG